MELNTAPKKQKMTKEIDKIYVNTTPYHKIPYEE